VEGFLELEESRLSRLLASITIRQTQRSASHESSLAIHRLFDPGLEGVADETGDKPPQRDMLLLGESAEVAEQIVGQNDENARIGVHCDPSSAISRRQSSEVQGTDKFR